MTIQVVQKQMSNERYDRCIPNPATSQDCPVCCSVIFEDNGEKIGETVLEGEDAKREVVSENFLI